MSGRQAEPSAKVTGTVLSVTDLPGGRAHGNGPAPKLVTAELRPDGGGPYQAEAASSPGTATCGARISTSRRRATP